MLFDRNIGVRQREINLSPLLFATYLNYFAYFVNRHWSSKTKVGVFSGETIRNLPTVTTS